VASGWIHLQAPDNPNALSDESNRFSDAVAEAWDRWCDRAPDLETWVSRQRGTTPRVAHQCFRSMTGSPRSSPVEPLRAAADLPSAFEPLIKKLLSRRAEASGLPDPPFPE